MAGNKRAAAMALEHIINNLGPGTTVAINPAASAGQFSACEASLKIARSQHYRADEAPELPLRDCAHPDRCICVYSVQDHEG